MAIVPDFQYDIFISYAHIDDLKLGEQDRGWVEDLHNTVLTRVWQELGTRPAIWRDQSDLDGQRADPSIYNALHNSAVLLVVMSPAYMKQPYCGKELAEFLSYQHPAFDLVVRGFSRAVTVVNEDVDVGQWREELRNGPVVGFTVSDPATGDVKRLMKPPRTDPDHPYIQAIEKLVRHLKAILGELQRGPTAGTEVATAKTGGRQLPVYLAETTDDLQQQYGALLDLVGRGSKRLGEKVLPERSILQSVSVMQACHDGLARANASIHLVSAVAGRIWGDAGKPLAQLQLDEALKRPDKPRPLVWISPDLKPESAGEGDFRRFLDALKAGKLASQTAEARTPELFEMPFERFLGQLETRLFPPPKTVWREVKKQQPGGMLVYISYRVVGQDRIPVLVQFLRSRKYSVSVLDHGANGADVCKRHETNLRFCDGLLVLYGQDGLGWAEDLALHARITAQQSHRPKRLAIMGAASDAAREFGLIDDLVVPVALDSGGQFRGMDEFLGGIEEGDNA